MNRWADIAILTLLALALARGVYMARETPTAAPAGIPLVQTDMSAGTLDKPGAVRHIATNQMAVVGEVWTIEDLARAAQMLQDGGLPGVMPLSERTAAELKDGLTKAQASREKLTTIQGEIRATEAQLVHTARQLASTLTPEQRAWIIAQRDRISVSEVEQRYWDTLLMEDAP